LLRVAQILVRALELLVELRLMRRQCDVLAELAQELTLAAAETIGRLARRDENSEHTALDLERGEDQGAEPGSGELLREVEGNLCDIRLVNEPPLNRSRQAVRIDWNISAGRHPELARDALTSGLDHGQCERPLLRLVQRGKGKVQVEFGFE